MELQRKADLGDQEARVVKMDISRVDEEYLLMIMAGHLWIAKDAAQLLMIMEDVLLRDSGEDHRLRITDVNHQIVREICHPEIILLKDLHNKDIQNSQDEDHLLKVTGHHHSRMDIPILALMIEEDMDLLLQPETTLGHQEGV